MEQEYYWIEINFPLLGFWGAAFKFWKSAKEAKKKLSDKVRFHAFKLINKGKIRSPA